MKKILSIALISLLLLTGCNSNEKSSSIKLRDKVLALYSNTNYKKSGLNKNETELIKNLLDNENENKEINVSKLITKDENHKVDEPDSYGVYEKDGEYFIKYSDIEFDTYSIEVMSEYKSKQTATVIAGGYFTEIKKENIPLLGTDTKDSLIYDYHYINTFEDDNKIIYYYQSYYDNTGMEMVFTKKDDKIENIRLDYSLNVKVEEEKEESNAGVKVGSEVFIVLLVAGLVFIFLKVIKNAAFNAR